MIAFVREEHRKLRGEDGQLEGAKNLSIESGFFFLFRLKNSFYEIFQKKYYF